MKSLIQLGVDGLVIPYHSLKILQFLNIVIEKGIQPITLLLKPLPLIFEPFHCDGQILVFFVGPLIFIIYSLDLNGDLLDLVESGIIHSFLEGVFPDKFFNLDACLL